MGNAGFRGNSRKKKKYTKPKISASQAVKCKSEIFYAEYDKKVNKIPCP